MLVYSVIFNSVVKGWKPLHGWSKEYLVLITRTSAETVSKALDRLEELGFLTVLTECVSDCSNCETVN